jgi:hypothetical protein
MATPTILLFLLAWTFAGFVIAWFFGQFVAAGRGWDSETCSTETRHVRPMNMTITTREAANGSIVDLRERLHHFILSETLASRTTNAGESLSQEEALASLTRWILRKH